MNITKPYEIDAAGEKWSKIPIDEATKKFLQEYGASVFKEGGKWRTKYAHDWLDNYGQNDWDKRTVYLQDKNKTVWEATLHIANSADGRKILYDIDPIKMTEGAGKQAPTTVNESLPQSTNNVKTQYSLTDTESKRLSKGQQDYFKDSKVRDENGNLKVMYHGSQDAGFHTFEGNRSDDGISFFFVDRNDVAASYPEQDWRYTGQ